VVSLLHGYSDSVVSRSLPPAALSIAASCSLDVDEDVLNAASASVARIQDSMLNTSLSTEGDDMRREWASAVVGDNSFASARNS
jgi:hypothetical protein